MESESQNLMKYLKSGVFPHTSPVNLSFKIEKIGPIEYSENDHEIIKNIFLDDIEKYICTGIMWKFNPLCLELFIQDGSFEYKKESLLDYLINNCEIWYDEMDRNSHVYYCCIPLKFLLINAIQLDSKLINSCESAIVTTPMGDVEVV